MVYTFTRKTINGTTTGNMRYYIGVSGIAEADIASMRQQTHQSVSYRDELTTRYFRRSARHVHEYTGSFIGLSISRITP